MGEKEGGKKTNDICHAEPGKYYLVELNQDKVN